jgi:GT2 family glycosyltransferase
LVVKRSVINKIGGFPEDVDFFYSDNLYADVLRYHGIKHALISSCMVSHKPSTTLYWSKDFEYFVGTVQENKYKIAREKWLK